MRVHTETLDQNKKGGTNLILTGWDRRVNVREVTAPFIQDEGKRQRPDLVQHMIEIETSTSKICMCIIIYYDQV